MSTDPDNTPPGWVVFFAVPQEAGPLLRNLRRRGFGGVPVPPPQPGARGWRIGTGQVWVTGMGRRRALAVAQAVLGDHEPAWILTCGFAGGLDPSRATGDLVADLDPWFPAETPSHPRLRPGRFHCANRVIAKAADKARLRAEDGADAVEMESEAIRQLCAARGIPSGTIRVISDAANEDLPLDFGALMTADDRMDYGRLAGALIRSPGATFRLIRFSRGLGKSASSLADVLEHFILAEATPPT